MMYAIDPNGLPGLTEDGGIPLTYEMLAQIAFRPFPIREDENDLTSSESLDSGESEDSLSIPLSSAQAIELVFFGGTILPASVLRLNLSLLPIPRNPGVRAVVSWGRGGRNVTKRERQYQ